MPETTSPPATRSTGSMLVGALAGVGLHLVLTGLSFLGTKWQMRRVAEEIGAASLDIGDGFLVAAPVLLALGVTALVAAYRLRSRVERTSVAVAAFVVALLLSSYVVGFAATRAFPFLI